MRSAGLRDAETSRLETRAKQGSGHHNVASPSAEQVGGQARRHSCSNCEQTPFGLAPGQTLDLQEPAHQHCL